MLTLYRRHLKSCPYQDRYWKRCRCPVWVEGVHRGAYVRRSLKVNSWERAQEEITSWDRPFPLTQALDAFYLDAVHRNLRPASLKKYRGTIKRLKAFGESKGIRQLQQLNLPALREFRASWNLSPKTAGKVIELLRSFFTFCIQSNWLTSNPAVALKVPRSTHRPTLPFTSDEVSRIISACPNDFIRAFVYVLRYTGMRISDAALLTTDKLNGNRIFLYAAKTGQPVYVPVPDFLADMLRAIKPKAGYFFLRGQSTRLETVTDLWRRQLNKVFAAAKVEHGHAHRFRDTFAVALLLAGVPLEHVSILLGHSSIKVTEKHYAPWVRQRQELLEEQVRKTWRAPLFKIDQVSV